MTFIFSEAIKQYRRKCLIVRGQCHPTVVDVLADTAGDGQLLL